eukprot:TRINITY_DN3851_c0_g1_i2.p2 TRINITY_DN3851_c0_g1~~TRINITY_DN3851_c0_g1_i2.p2  ORF type:complete len:103 (+),score=15.17 TRINITY_DN3851_c0_g1_i2:195-503(+)
MIENTCFDLFLDKLYVTIYFNPENKKMLVQKYIKRYKIIPKAYEIMEIPSDKLKKRSRIRASGEDGQLGGIDAGAFPLHDFLLQLQPRFAEPLAFAIAVRRA